ncbi:MAG: SufD family Fe-S cluster assembly protein [Bacilli bacterium]|nr:SufD family Fe-S cluster assembly protein [Bacilli bacterium]
MNKIILALDKIKEEIDDTIEVELSKKQTFAGVNTLKIKALKDTDLEIIYEEDEIKYDIYVELLPKINVNIYEQKQKGSYKLSYHYNLNELSKANIYKVNDAKKIKESITINLNGKEAKASFLLKTISKNEEKYDIMVYHKASQTESCIITNGVNIKKGKLEFNVSGFVPKGIKECIVNQNNRIINLTDEVSQIRPNLFIDENNVIANHSAHIGKCNENEMFYLMSRGITAKNAENLIVKGFLTSGLEYYKQLMEKIINKYWN